LAPAFFGEGQVVAIDGEGADPEFDLQLLIVDVADHDLVGRALLRAVREVARPRLAADVPADGRGLGDEGGVLGDGRHIRRGDPLGTVDGGVDAEPVGVLRGEVERPEGQIVVADGDLGLGLAGGDREGLVEVAHAVLEGSVRQGDLGGGEAPGCRRFGPRVRVAVGAAVGAAAVALGVVAFAAVAGGQEPEAHDRKEAHGSLLAFRR
jgi:hypothetical protein